MAGVELGSAFISVGLGTNTLGSDIKKAFAGAESSGSDAGKSAGRGFGGAFGIAAAAVGALGIGSFFKSAVSGAGTLEQSMGAINSVFAGSAGQMHEWAKSAANDVGLTQNEFNELGTLIGSQLKNGGTAMDELGPKTKDLIGTGADLASMFGGTTSEAVSALSSALKGERDPIEAYGVSLSQAKIDAEAAALGFAKVGGSLSAEANQAATLSLIMKQTADAHGNFASEADTLAGKQQRLNAVWENGKTQIGSALLPAVSALTGALLSGLGPALVGAQVVIRELIGGFTAMGAAFRAGDGDITSSGFAGVMEHIGGVARSVFDTVGPLFQQFGAVFRDLAGPVLGFAAAFSPIGLLFKAIQPVLPQIVALLSSLAGVLSLVLTQALVQLTPIMEQLVAQFSSNLIAIMPVINAMFLVFMDALTQIVPVVMSLLAAILPLVSSLMTQLAPIITSLVTSILPPLMSIFGNIVTAIAPLITILVAALIPAIEALLPVVVTVFSFVAELIKNVMQAVQGVIQVVTGIITGDWDKVWTGIGNIFGAIWKNIVTIVTGAIAILGSLISMGMSNASRIIGAALDGIVGFFGDLGGKITSALSGAGTWLVSVGKNIVQGLIDGVSGMVGNAVKAVTDIGGSMLDGVKNFLGIHSPSRVFRNEVGLMIGSGVIEGLNASQRGVTASVNSLVSVPTVPTFGAGSYSASLAEQGATGGITVYIGNEAIDPHLVRVAQGHTDQLTTTARGRMR